MNMFECCLCLNRTLGNQVHDLRTWQRESGLEDCPFATLNTGVNIGVERFFTFLSILVGDLNIYIRTNLSLAMDKRKVLERISVL